MLQLVGLKIKGSWLPLTEHTLRDRHCTQYHTPVTPGNTWHNPDEGDMNIYAS